MTTKTAWVPDLTATVVKKTATATEKTATVAINTATIVKKTATIGHVCKLLKWFDLNGHPKDRYDGMDNYLHPQEDHRENAPGHWGQNNHRVDAGINRLEFQLNHVRVEVDHVRFTVNSLQPEINRLSSEVNPLEDKDSHLRGVLDCLRDEYNRPRAA